MATTYCRLHLIVLIALFFSQCGRKDSDQKVQNDSDTTSATVSSIEIDTANYNHSYQTCACDWKLKRFNSHQDLGFSYPHFNLDSLSKWKDNPARLQIKSLTLVNFDTIPAEMRIFENVETLTVEGHGATIQGLEIFPSLRYLQAFAEHFDLSQNPRLLRNIEVIDVNKSRFSGIKSFKQLPNLREVRMGYSGFDSFPNDFESLKCLTYFQTGASTDREIDLTKLDLSNLKCLEYLEFHSWGKNMKGIPRGMDHIETVTVHHGNLTKAERAELKKIRTHK